MWDIAKGKLRHTLTGHSASVNAMAFALGGKVLVSGSGLVAGDYELIFWDMPDGKLRRKTKEQTANIVSLAVTPDGRTVVSGSTNGKVYFWNPADGKLIKTLAVDTNSKPLTVSPDGRRLACDDSNLSSKCRICVWELPSGKLLHHLPHPASDNYRTLGFSPDGGMLLAHTGGTVQLWDVGAGVLRYAMFSDSGADAVALSADGRLLATWSGRDKALKFWNADHLYDARLQKAMAPFLAAGGQGRLVQGMLHLTLSVRGRRSAAALDAIAAMPYPVALKLTASDNLNDRDLGRLKDAKNLRHLDLEGAPWLAEEGLRRIAELTSLTSLALNSPRVNDQGLDHLRHLKSLRGLQLGDTDVTPAGIDRLQRACRSSMLANERRHCKNAASP